VKITDLRARTVAIPLEAPLRHNTGVHPGYFLRTIIEVETDEGIVGLGEVGGGDQRGKFESLKPRVVGEDPFHLERIKQKTLRQIYYLSNPRVYATIEVACLDIMGKATNRRVCDLVGGPLREEVPFSGYLFYRYEENGRGGEETPEAFVEHAHGLVEEYGFTEAKLKGGVLPPERDVAVMTALREEFGSSFGLRLDPNGVWSIGTAMHVARQVADLGLEYLEDPTWGQAGMARVREKAAMPLATNMCVTNFSDVPGNEALKAVDVILSDIYYWEGITGVKYLANICDTFKYGLSMHSGAEFGVTLAAMVHVAATLPNLSYSCDAHYHHLLDDVIAGGKMRYENGSIKVPEGPGLGVELDEEKMEEYERYFEERGDYYARYHEDVRRPEWFPVVPVF
jgi:glucarate dehydratase